MKKILIKMRIAINKIRYYILCISGKVTAIYVEYVFVVKVICYKMH